MLTMLDKFKLRGPRVLVRQLSAISMTDSGLFLPETQTAELHHRGVVERVGPGERREDGTVRPVQDIGEGDLVYFAKFAGSTLVLDGQPRLLLMEDEVQGSIDASDFAVVRHPEQADGEADHLFGEPCAICRAREEAEREPEARESLRQMREQLVHGGRQ